MGGLQPLPSMTRKILIYYPLKLVARGRSQCQKCTVFNNSASLKGRFRDFPQLPDEHVSNVSDSAGSDTRVQNCPCHISLI